MLYPAAIVMFAAFFAGIMGLALVSGSRSSEMFMMLGLPAIVTALFVAYRVVRRTRAAVDSRHASTAPVLTILRWTDQTIVLECASPSYALALRQANPTAAQVRATGS